MVTLFGADLLPLEDPFGQNADLRFSSPNNEHIFGTDQFGRDMLSRVIYGTRTSLAIGTISVLSAMTIGSAIGMLSAMGTNRLNRTIGIINDAITGIPILLIAIIIIITSDFSVVTLTASLVFAFTPYFIRFSRTLANSFKELGYFKMAIAKGAGIWHLTVKHLIPHSSMTIITYAIGLVGMAIITESALNFLGLGVPPPTPSLGGILQESRSYLENAPWLALIPGSVLAIMSIGFVFMGDYISEYNKKLTKVYTGNE